MKVRLLGSGAVGAPLALRLSGVSSFALITDEKRRSRYLEDGLIINGKKYCFDVECQGNHDADLIILACKNFSLKEAMDEMESFVGDNTVIISLLNGVESERILSRRFGEDKVIYSFITSLSSNREGNEITCFSSEGGLILFNERDNKVSRRIERIASLFDKAGIRYKIPLDIHHEIWWKFMLNTCFNSLSGVLGTPYDKIVGNEGLFRAARVVASEVQMVARSEGIELSEDDIEKMMAMMSSFSGCGKTSMLQDIEAGRMTENRYFTGTDSALAAKHSLKTPDCDFLYNLVEAASYAQK